MNDRYLFRAWDTNEKKMDYDVVICKTGVAVVEYGEICGNYEEGWMILMQCTGLKDKNRKLIWEGDLIEGENGSIWKVIWLDGAFFLYDMEEVEERFLANCDLKELEVIGNIYDNPELVEV